VLPKMFFVRHVLSSPSPSAPRSSKLSTTLEVTFRA
jgi:hypothetical protein